MHRSEPRPRFPSFLVTLTALTAAATALSCVPRTRYSVPVSTRAIAATSDVDTSFDASIQGVADANMMVKQQDRAAGVIRTEWQETFIRYSAGSPPSRRLRFDVTVTPGNVTVAPRVETCSDIDADVGCEPANSLNEDEAGLAARLVNTIEANVREREVAMNRRPQLQPQAGRDRIVLAPSAPAAPVQGQQGGTQVIINPAPQSQAPLVVAPALPAHPNQRGPLLIETRRAGRQEVSAGRDVEVTTVNGNRLTGKILFVSPEGIVVNVGTEVPITLWARDIEQIHFL